MTDEIKIRPKRALGAAELIQSLALELYGLAQACQRNEAMQERRKPLAENKAVGPIR